MNEETHPPAQAHWDTVYATKSVDSVSWFEEEASYSLALIRSVRPDRASAIIDVGAGASTLVDGLVSEGYETLTMLDIAGAALATSRERLGQSADAVTWLVGDVTALALPDAAFDVWHDRAVFHFLTTSEAREAYVAQVRRAVRAGGYVIVGTFADDGPLRCSGLEVCRYTPESLHAVFGDGFTFVSGHRHAHVTPGGATQQFQFCVCRRDREDVTTGRVAP
jgi:ubiquinone/menaquinone biosynthesis C-methylase UbiE